MAVSSDRLSLRQDRRIIGDRDFTRKAVVNIEALKRGFREPPRWRLLGIVALAFAFAQVMVAAHAGGSPDEFLNHSKTSCVTCVAGAAADDPWLSIVSVEPPAQVFVAINFDARTRLATASRILAADPRGPPSF